jgi:hypothetical protein
VVARRERATAAAAAALAAALVSHVSWAALTVADVKAASRERRTPAAEAAVTRVLLADYALTWALSLAAQAAAPSHTAYIAPHALLAYKWVALQLPVRHVVLPEAARTLSACVAACALHGAPASLSACVASLAAAAGTYGCVLLAVGVFHSRQFEERVMAHGLEACPAALALAVDVVCGFVERATFLLTYEPPLDSVAFGAVLLAAAALTLLAPPPAADEAPHVLCARGGALLALAAAATVASKRHLSAAGLRHLEERLGVERRSREARERISSLQEVHATSPIVEPELLVAVADKLCSLFPLATGVAVATLESALSAAEAAAAAASRQRSADGGGAWEEAAEGGAGRRLSHWHASGSSDAARAVLEASLPRLVDAAGDGCDAASSSAAAFVAERAGAHGSVVAYSHDWPAGMHAFSDWEALLPIDDGPATPKAAAAAADADVPFRPVLAVTVGVVSGATALGFATLTFSDHAGFAGRPGDASPHATLCDVGRSLGDAVAACRARAAAKSSAAALDASAAALDASAAVARDIFPAHLVDAVTHRLARTTSARSSDGAGGGGGGGGGGGDALAAAAGGVPAGPVGVLGAFHPEVTVLFTDVVSWTSIADALAPQETMELLDSLWQRFDSLAIIHGLYKARPREMCVRRMRSVATALTRICRFAPWRRQVETIGDSCACPSPSLMCLLRARVRWLTLCARFPHARRHGCRWHAARASGPRALRAAPGAGFARGVRGGAAGARRRHPHPRRPAQRARQLGRRGPRARALLPVRRYGERGEPHGVLRRALRRAAVRRRVCAAAAAAVRRRARAGARAAAAHGHQGQGRDAGAPRAGGHARRGAPARADRRAVAVCVAAAVAHRRHRRAAAQLQQRVQRGGGCDGGGRGCGSSSGGRASGGAGGGSTSLNPARSRAQHALRFA